MLFIPSSGASRENVSLFDAKKAAIGCKDDVGERREPLFLLIVCLGSNYHVNSVKKCRYYKQSIVEQTKQMS